MQPTANIADIREWARRKLPRPIFDWVDGGSFEERTLRANSADFARLQFRRRALLDGGVRSGQDVLKAVALGARGCLIGRAQLYGLAVEGEAGVRRVINVIREEIDITMGLTGVSDIPSVPSMILYPPDGTPSGW